MKPKNVKRKLEARIADYEKTIKADPNSGKGYTKPGSQNRHKN